jgi:hypothetical protein
MLLWLRIGLCPPSLALFGDGCLCTGLETGGETLIGKPAGVPRLGGNTLLGRSTPPEVLVVSRRSDGCIARGACEGLGHDC